jgi:hypothetical protein
MNRGHKRLAFALVVLIGVGLLVRMVIAGAG